MRSQPDLRSHQPFLCNPHTNRMPPARHLETFCNRPLTPALLFAAPGSRFHGIGHSPTWYTHQPRRSQAGNRHDRQPGRAIVPITLVDPEIPGRGRVQLGQQKKFPTGFHPGRVQPGSPSAASRHRPVSNGPSEGGALPPIPPGDDTWAAVNHASRFAVPLPAKTGLAPPGGVRTQPSRPASGGPVAARRRMVVLLASVQPGSSLEPVPAQPAEPKPVPAPSSWCTWRRPSQPAANPGSSALARAPRSWTPGPCGDPLSVLFPPRNSNQVHSRVLGDGEFGTPGAHDPGRSGAGPRAGGPPVIPGRAGT